MAGTVNRLETIDDLAVVLCREKEFLMILQAITYI
jgi:hypothetical protein